MIAVALLSAVAFALVGANQVAETARRKVDAARRERDLARKARNDAEAALVLARVTAWRADFERPTTPFEATPVYARLMDRRASFARDLRVIRDLPETEDS